MPKYSYVVKDNKGKTYKDIIEEISETALIARLQAQGFFIISVKELKTSAPVAIKKHETKRKYSHNDCKLEDLLTFARQLATMLESGVTLIRSLTVIEGQIQSQQLSKAILQIKKDIEQGQSLSPSIAKHPKIFNQFWVSLVEVGEASGTMPVVLNKLAFYMEQQAAFKSTIISGIMYPAILFLVSIGAVMFFALFVGPRFQTIFESMGVDLPLITVIFLSTFSFIKKNILIIIGSVVGIVFLFKNYAKTYSGRLNIEHFLYGLPTVGEIYKLIIVERFTSQMAILIDAGVPILYALDISEKLVDDLTCGQIINDIKEGVKKGGLLVDQMQSSGFFPPMAVQMILVGEETGELSKMLKHVAEFYQENVSTFMKRFSTIIEPIMLVFMGGIIGTIVLAMFLPMFNITQLGGAGGG
ncbi:MAG TPA: type II secretion system F family protein [Candidatus Omnitrophota bacterium]|nr:type II secretion system F family protein [Candidatus Omnitrophota bacterium]